MIALRHITIIDDSIPLFSYKGKRYILDIEDYKRLLAESLPERESVSYDQGDKIVKTPYHPTEADLTTDDIKKYIIDNLADWREEGE